MRRTGSITARSLGRQIFDPGRDRWGGYPGRFCSLTLGLAGMRQPRTRPPDGLQGCLLLGLLFPWAPPPPGQTGCELWEAGEQG